MAAELHAVQGYLDAKEAARFLKVSRAWVYRYSEEGRIPHYKLGGVLRFRMDELEEWMAKHRGRLIE